MDKKEMTKKHLITCSVMVVMVIISSLNIYSTSARNPGISSVKMSPRFSRFLYEDPDVAYAFSFANEPLPVNDASVNKRLNRSLLKHNFKFVQSNILQRKAEKLFPIIEPLLKAYGIPDDFKYIPLVESGFSEGTSARGAKGVWQFMPGTARTYGLKVGHGVDERTNVRKSTIAACKYIKELYAQFNSWTLAAAAYNNGEIKLSKAINKQSEDNYFRMRLNRETGAYVYNLIAMKAIISEPTKYGYNKFYKVDSKKLGLTEFVAVN